MSPALDVVSNELVGLSGLPGLQGIELVSPERAAGEGKRVCLKSLRFLFNSAGGLRVPPEAPGCGAPCPSSPLVSPGQHDREWCPARAWWERPHSGSPAVQEPPGAHGVPAAGPGRWPATAGPQNAPGTLRPRIPMRQPQPASWTAGRRQQDNWQLMPLSTGLKTDLKRAVMSLFFTLFYFYDGIISQSTFS